MLSCRLLVWSILLLGFVALGGCEEEFTPIIDTGRPFTLWGTLDPREGVQKIRVVPIRLQLDAEVGTADATVVAENLGTGAMYTWRDSIVAYPDGPAGFVYLSDFTPDYGERYRITATRADGVASTVFLEIPPIVEPFVSVPEGPIGLVELPVFWLGAPRVNAAEVTYGALGPSCGETPITLALEESEVEPAKFGWVTNLPLSRHAAEIKGRLGSNATVGRITVHALVTNAEWKPPFGFTFDPDITVEPGTVSNVQNGFGFVGGAYAAEMTWQPDADLVSQMGLTVRCGL